MWRSCTLPAVTVRLIRRPIVSTADDGGSLLAAIRIGEIIRHKRFRNSGSGWHEVRVCLRNRVARWCSALYGRARAHRISCRAIADGGYQGKVTADEVQEDAGIPLEIVKRSDVVKGFLVLPKRWIVERTYGWLGRCRRLAKDYENLTHSHVAFIILAMIRLMLRGIVRLAAAT
jgi:transposase